MKQLYKSVLSFSFLTLSLGVYTKAFCQLGKGDFLAGGNMSISSSRNYFNDQLTGTGTQFRLSPVFGYFIIDRLAAGARINYAYETGKSRGNSVFYKWHIRDVGIGPFVRYYFLATTQKMNLLAEASYLFSSSKTVQNPQVYKTEMQTLGISAGPAFFLNPHVALEVLAGYRRQRVPENKFTASVFQVQVGLQFYPGSLQHKKSSR